MEYKFRKYTHLNRMGEKGVQLVIDYLSEQRYKCKDVQKVSSAKGYDILIEKDNKKETVEVKTTQKDKGIPDCYSSEFDKNNKFIADRLYVIRLDNNFLLKKIEFLKKEEINSYIHKRIERIRISSKLKTELFKNKVGEIIKLE